MVSIRAGLLFLSLLVFAGAPLAAETPVPASHLVIAPCDVGDRYQFEMVTCAIELKNTGDKPIHVSKGEAKLPWDSMDSGTIIVPPQSTSYINAHVDLLNSVGWTQRYFRIATDESRDAHRGALVRAFVSTALDQDRPSFDFGVVTLGKEEQPEKTVSLSSREVSDFRILGVLSKPAYTDIEIGPDRKTVSARLRRDAPLGLLTDYVKLKINAPQQSIVWIAIKGDVHGEVVPDANPFTLGVIRTGQAHEFLIRLTSASGQDFRVGTLELDKIRGSAESAPCVPATKGCRLARLKVDDTNALGKLEGTLRVELPDYGKQLPIAITGMLLSPDTPVHNLDELLAKSTTEGGESSTAAVSKSIDLKKIIQHTVHDENAVPPPGHGPLLKWSAAHQDLIYGYAIYRADNASGPFLRVNKDIIRVVQEGDDKSGSYQWRDNTAESGKTYWYSIGVINRNGSKQDLTGAQKVVAK